MEKKNIYLCTRSALLLWGSALRNQIYTLSHRSHAKAIEKNNTDSRTRYKELMIRCMVSLLRWWFKLHFVNHTVPKPSTERIATALNDSLSTRWEESLKIVTIHMLPAKIVAMVVILWIFENVYVEVSQMNGNRTQNTTTVYGAYLAAIR